MKKLARMICVFCAITAPQAIQCYGYGSNEHIKTILADYIDGTQEYWMAKCSDALEAYNKELKEKKLTADQQVQLLLDGLYLKRIWRIVGDDPYFANWVAKLYATLVSYNCSGYKGTKYHALYELLYNNNSNEIGYGFKNSYDALKIQKTSREKVKNDNDNDNDIFAQLQYSKGDEDKIKQLPGQTKAMTGSISADVYDEDLNKSIIGVNENTSEEDKAKIIAIKNEVKKCLQHIYNTLNLGANKHVNQLQKALLPEELIYNIKANNRLIWYIISATDNNAENSEKSEKSKKSKKKDDNKAQRELLSKSNSERASCSADQSKTYKQDFDNGLVQLELEKEP